MGTRVGAGPDYTTAARICSNRDCTGAGRDRDYARYLFGSAAVDYYRCADDWEIYRDVDWRTWSIVNSGRSDTLGTADGACP